MAECHQQWEPPTRGNNISLHDCIMFCPHTLQEGATPILKTTGKGNIQDLKICLLRKLFFYLEYSSEISTNNLIWMDHKSVSKFSGCPSLEKNSWQCPRLYSILFKFTDTATKLYKLNNGPTAGLSNFIILVEFISYQCVHYFLHTAAYTIAHSCHMRESVSSISFSGSITIILNWQLDELSLQLHAWWGSGEKHCLPDYTEVKPVWYFRHYWIIHIHTYTHMHASTRTQNSCTM